MKTFTLTNNDASIEDITQEAWGWEAAFSDGMIIKQFDNRDGTFHRFKEIGEYEARSHAHIVAFMMQKQGGTDGDRIEIVMDGYKRPIHFYQNTVLNVGIGQEERHRTIVFGYQEHGQKQLHYLFEDGRVVIKNGEL